MSRAQRLMWVCLMMMWPVGAAQGDPGPSPNQLADELKALKAHVEKMDAQREREMQALREDNERLRAKAGESWLNERRAQEVKGLIQEVLADADARASLMAEGAVAGYNGSNFFLASADGSFLLRLSGQLQVRYLLNSRDSGDAAAIDDTENGFQMRRAKLGFDGHIGNPKLEYGFLLAANRDSGAVELEDAWLAYQLSDNWRIWAGRFMDKFAREQMMSSRRQLAVDRSAVANIFAANDDYVEGVGLEWVAMPDFMRLAVTINDGFNSGTPGAGAFQNLGNDFHNDATDVAVTARIDLKLAGDWKQNADASSWSTASDLQAFIGAGVHYEIGESGDGNAAATAAPIGAYDSFLQWTVDGLVKCHGAALMAAVYGWHFDAAAGNALGNTDHYAATIQLAYMVIPDRLEPFVRYEWISVDDDLDTDELNIIAAGLNWYFRGHNAKFTADAVYCLDNVNATNTFGVGLSGIGLLGDTGDEDGQFVIRLQFQLLY